MKTIHLGNKILDGMLTTRPPEQKKKNGDEVHEQELTLLTHKNTQNTMPALKRVGVKHQIAHEVLI